MKRFFNQSLLMIMGLMAIAAVLVSCEKDDKEDSNSGAVELLSFGPTGARHGDSIRFFGNNFDKVTAIHFSGNNAVVEKADFKVHTQQEIFVLVPNAAEKGFVTLKTAAGDVVSKTQFNLNVLTQISSITASARPGSNITINGAYLNWVKSITFADGKLVENFVTQTFDQIVVTVPEDAKTGTLILAYGGTDSANLETSEVLDVVLPKATGFATASIKHADNLTINGTDLDLVRNLFFTGVSGAITSFVSQSATQLVVKVPAGATTGTLTLEAASGEKTTSPSLTLILPAATDLNPNPLDPGADLTITGTNLDLVTSVQFENAAPVTSFVSQSATEIVVTAPMGILRGQLTLGVLNSTVTVKSEDVLEITGSAPPPTVALVIVDEGDHSNWTGTGGWVGAGWGGTANYNNSSPVRSGSKSARIDYVGGWGAPLQFGSGNLTVAAYTHFKISIFGAPGSAGKKVNIGINGADTQTITIVEGEWTDYAFPIGSLTGAAAITDIILKEFSGTGGFTIYVDAMGLN